MSLIEIGKNYLDAKGRYIRGGTMNEKEIKAMIERSVVEFEHLKKIEKIQYIMDFGKVYIQYDFCLN